MQGDNHDLRVSARTARLTAGFDDGAGPPYRFGGIAVAAGDILHMDDGTRVLMTEEELRKAADSQAGEPLTKDHPEDDQGRPKYPPDVDETFGKVPKAGWIESQRAVGYEATTHDEELAAGVRGGSFDVSVHPFFDTVPYDGPEADVVATNIEFADLSVVAKGDSPSATAEWGPNQAIASWTESADFGEELTAQGDATITAPDFSGYSVSGWERPTLSETYDGDLEAAANAAVVEFRPVESFDEDLSLWVVDGERQLNLNALDSAWVLASQVGGLAEEDVERARDQIESLAEQARDAGEIDDEEWEDVWQPRVQGQATAGVSGLISSTIRGTLRALGVGETELTADGDTGQSTTGAESPTDSGSDPDMDRKDIISDLSDDFDEEWLEDQDDGVLEQLHQKFEESDDDTSTDTPGDDAGADTTDGGGDGQTLADMTVDDLAEGLQERGFVTEANAESVVQEAEARASKAEKVDEIIAKSDDYDEDDREDLLASADKIVEREHKRVRGELAASLPGAVGGAGQLTATAGEDGELDEYGTGVQGEAGESA